MSKTLYLLDGMALLYRAHFALIRSPIFTSSGVNTSAIYGFTNTLLDIIENRKPDYIAIAMDTADPTERHTLFPDYKAQRDDIPEDIAAAIPAIDRLADAFRIPVLRYPGHEADDIIGTVARRAEAGGIDTFMVTPDKDFAQLVSDRIRILKPGRQGSEADILDRDRVCETWNIERPEQVIDILGLWGDASDNIPGVPGIGEKTAKKLIAEYGSIENLLNHLDELKGKQKERLAESREAALLARKLVTINTEVPVEESIEDLALREPDEEKLKPLFVEWEFNTIGKRILGDAFKAGRGFGNAEQQDLFGGGADLATLETTPHSYRLAADENARRELVEALSKQTSVCFDLETDSLDVRSARIAGIAFSWRKGEGWYASFPADQDAYNTWLHAFEPFFLDERIEKTGHNLKFDLGVLRWHGIRVAGPMFDTMIAHVLVEPDRRHGMDELAEQYLGYSPVPITRLIGEDRKDQLSMLEVSPEEVCEYAAEDADVTLQLRRAVEPLLEPQGQKEVFFGIEMPLVSVLVDMEHAGIALDGSALDEVAKSLEQEITHRTRHIYELAGEAFNLNSPKQLGEILFDKLKLVEKAKKTRTGQYSTNEQVLSELAADHEIVRDILAYREAAKLKSTYVDALPQSVFSGTGRIHTTFSQTGAVTGRLASSNPNLQNIPIRTEQGQLIRKAFVARDDDHILLAADYSQIELRVMADMSGDEGLREAFREGHDIHAATASGVFGVPIEDVDAGMRRTAKMVNFGIIYGISAFGLAQRLSMPRSEAAAVIDAYFEQFPGVKHFMDRIVRDCRANGYVETKSGRRRYIRDIDSSNHTIRTAAERTAINSPIQGTAADMIKIAMNRIHAALIEKQTASCMVLQVHDELVFDVRKDELETVRKLVEEHMLHALPLDVPVVVDMGTGRNWLEAHG